MKKIIATTIIVIFISISFAFAQLKSVSILYKDYNNEVAVFSNQLNTYVMENAYKEFISHFEMQEDYQNYFGEWFTMIQNYKKEYQVDSIEVYLPTLGIQDGMAYTYCGYLNTFISNTDTSFIEEFKLPSLVLKFGNGKLIFTDDDTQEIEEEANVEIKKIHFSVEPDLRSALYVNCEYEIVNRTNEDLKNIKIYFLHPLAIKKFQINGKPVKASCAFGSYEAQSVCCYNIVLDEILQPEEEIGLEFEYNVDYRIHNLGRKPVGFSEDRGFVLFETGWYPKLNPGMIEIIPYDIEIIVPEGYLATSSGKPIKKYIKGNKTYFTYSHQNPGLPHVVWGKYKEIKHAIGKQDVIIWVPLNSNLSEKHMIGALEKIFKAYSKILPNPEFEYPQKVVAVTRIGGYGPVGNLLLNDSYFESDLTTNIDDFRLVAHELTHAWINSITELNGKYHQFISEGFAEYYSTKCVGKVFGEQQEVEVWDGLYENYAYYAKRAVAPAKLSDIIRNSDNSMFRAVVYNKGASLYRELERIIGQKRLQTLLSEGFNRRRNKDFYLTDLEEIFVNYDSALIDYINQFISSAEHPDYQIKPVDDSEPFKKVKLTNIGRQSVVPLNVVAYNSKKKKIYSKDFDFSEEKEYELDFSNLKDIQEVVIDPNHYVLQLVVKNDYYPGGYVNRSDESLLKEYTVQFLNSIQNKNVEVFSNLIAADPKNISEKARQSYIGVVRSDKGIKYDELSNFAFYKIQDNLIEVNFSVNLDFGRGAKKFAGFILYVSENNDWKIKKFRM